MDKAGCPHCGRDGRLRRTQECQPCGAGYPVGHGTTRRTDHGRYSAARVVTVYGGLFALIEVATSCWSCSARNAGNAFYKFIQSIAVPLALFFPGLFTFQNQDWAVIVTYGLDSDLLARGDENRRPYRAVTWPLYSRVGLDGEACETPDMAEHAQQESATTAQPRLSLRTSIVGVLASLVRWAGLVVVLIC